MGGTFIDRMTEAVSGGLRIEGSEIQIDAVYPESTPIADFLGIDFRVRHPYTRHARFSYTFSSGSSVASNLHSFEDFVKKQIASPEPIPTTPGSPFARGTGAD